MTKPLNIVTAIKSAMKPSPYPHLYKCEECDVEWVAAGYACTRLCFCGELVHAQKNPAYEKPVSMLTLQKAE